MSESKLNKHYIKKVFFLCYQYSVSCCYIYCNFNYFFMLDLCVYRNDLSDLHIKILIYKKYYHRKFNNFTKHDIRRIQKNYFELEILGTLFYL